MHCFWILRMVPHCRGFVSSFGPHTHVLGGHRSHIVTTRMIGAWCGAQRFRLFAESSFCWILAVAHEFLYSKEGYARSWRAARLVLLLQLLLQRLASALSPTRCIGSRRQRHVRLLGGGLAVCAAGRSPAMTSARGTPASSIAFAMG